MSNFSKQSSLSNIREENTTQIEEKTEGQQQNWLSETEPNLPPPSANNTWFSKLFGNNNDDDDDDDSFFVKLSELDALIDEHSKIKSFNKNDDMVHQDLNKIKYERFHKTINKMNEHFYNPKDKKYSNFKKMVEKCIEIHEDVDGSTKGKINITMNLGGHLNQIAEQSSLIEITKE